MYMSEIAWIKAPLFASVELHLSLEFIQIEHHIVFIDGSRFGVITLILSKN